MGIGEIGHNLKTLRNGENAQMEQFSFFHSVFYNFIIFTKIQIVVWRLFESGRVQNL